MGFWRAQDNSPEFADFGKIQERIREIYLDGISKIPMKFLERSLKSFGRRIWKHSGGRTVKRNPNEF